MVSLMVGIWLGFNGFASAQPRESSLVVNLSINATVWFATALKGGETASWQST